MKKLLLSILTFLYLMVSTGIAMEIHYCMGERSGIEFFGSKEDKCSKCGMTEKKGGCCSNEHKFFKFEDSFKHASNEIDFSFNGNDIAYDDFQIHHSYAIISHISVPHSFFGSPPKSTGPPIYIRNCVFRL